MRTTIVDMHAENWTPAQVIGHVLALLEQQGCQSLAKNGRTCEYSSTTHPNRCAVGLVLPEPILESMREAHFNGTVQALNAVGLDTKRDTPEAPLHAATMRAITHYYNALESLQCFHDPFIQNFEGWKKDCAYRTYERDHCAYLTSHVPAAHLARVYNLIREEQQTTSG